ncbi:MAG: sigma-70 family RNA polymerase sigma factor [Candidatus Eremiobacteraeota bacterium]|nr:sigma-70 family RNA polymerase sigma factor [Candidatus Eremiobacteraeota bacterium]
MHTRNEQRPGHLTSLNQSTFLETLNEHRGIVLKVASVYCSNPTEREDLVQTITAELWYAYPRYDSHFRFSTWMYRICVNVAISNYRRESRYSKTREPLEEAHLETRAADSPTPWDEQRSILYDFIEELGELDRALMLLYLDDMSHAEIADVLGISVTNVATKIGRIKLRFRNASTQLIASKKE